MGQFPNFNFGIQSLKRPQADFFFNHRLVCKKYSFFGYVNKHATDAFDRGLVAVLSKKGADGDERIIVLGLCLEDSEATGAQDYTVSPKKTSPTFSTVS